MMNDELVEYKFKELKDLMISKGLDLKELTKEIRKNNDQQEKRISALETYKVHRDMLCPVNKEGIKAMLREEIKEMPIKQIVNLGKVANALIKISIILCFLGGIVYAIGRISGQFE